MKRLIIMVLLILCIASPALAFTKTDSETLALIMIPYGTAYTDFEYKVEGTANDDNILYDFHRSEGFIKNYYGIGGWQVIASMEGWASTYYYSNGDEYDDRINFGEYEYAADDWMFSNTTMYWGGKIDEYIVGSSEPRHAENEITWFVEFDALHYSYHEYLVETNINV